MATETLNPSTALKRFTTTVEQGYMHMDSAEEPALSINPGASMMGLIAACQTRAATLNRALDMWACVGDVEAVAPGELAEMLRPTAEELAILLAELSDRQPAQ